MAADMAPLPAVMIIQAIVMSIRTRPLKTETAMEKMMEPPMMQKPTGREPTPTVTADGWAVSPVYMTKYCVGQKTSTAKKLAPCEHQPCDPLLKGEVTHRKRK